jgi:hypothetical protein
MELVDCSSSQVWDKITRDITCGSYSPRSDFTSNDYGKHKGTLESILMLMSTEFHVLICSLSRDDTT